MCDIQTHHGRGPFHVLCVPGLVPDGAETFLHQLPLLRRFGPVSLVTYPYERFVLDDVITSLVNELKRMVLSGRRVVLVGVSVGGGICLEMLRRLHEADQSIELAAFILLSPFTCTGDLAPLLARLYAGVEQEAERGADGRPAQALERGRSFFRALASRSQTSKPTVGGFRTMWNLLTPQGLTEIAEARIRARIERTLTNITVQGGVDRVMAIRQLRGLDPKADRRRPLTTAPTLILWGSK